MNINEACKRGDLAAVKEILDESGVRTEMTVGQRRPFTSQREEIEVLYVDGGYHYVVDGGWFFSSEAITEVAPPWCDVARYFRELIQNHAD